MGERPDQLSGPRAAAARQAWALGRRIVAHPANRRRRLRALARAARWQVRKRISSTPADIAFEGYVLRCHRDSSSASNVWYFTSRYDHAELTFLDRYLRPGDHLLDVGANIGTYALFAARRVGPTGTVTAVEAEPTALARLRHNVDRNHLGDRISVVPVAVDEVAGTVRFFVDRDVANGIVLDADRRDGTAVEVPAARLDDLVAPDARLVAAKLDVEGVEVRALAGAGGLLAERTPPVWITEVLAPQLRWFGATADDLLEAFARAGYHPYRFLVDENRLARMDPPIKGNAIFVAADRLAEVSARLGSPRPPSTRPG